MWSLKSLWLPKRFKKSTAISAKCHLSAVLRSGSYLRTEVAVVRLLASVNAFVFHENTSSIEALTESKDFFEVSEWKDDES